MKRDPTKKYVIQCFSNSVIMDRNIIMLESHPYSGGKWKMKIVQKNLQFINQKIIVACSCTIRVRAKCYNH